MNTQTIPTQVILTGSFVKYEKLKNLVLEAFRGSSANHINIYIDIYGLMKTLFSDSLRTDISDYTAVTSTIINMCGHYRKYFRGLGVESKIFLVFSYNCPYINNQFVVGYNNVFAKKMQNKVIREMVELNCNLLELLCPYLYDIHFVKTDFESSVMIHHLILREKESGNNNPNLIISKDLYPLQITCLHDDTVYMKPKKAFGEELTRITLPRQNKGYFDSFWRIYAESRNSTLDRFLVHPINVNLVSALSRFPERNLDNLISIPTANKIIFNLINSQATKILPSTIDYSLLKVSSTTIESRYRAIDVEFQYNVFLQTLEPRLLEYKNLDDVGTINQICAKYFTENPIDLDKL